MKSGHVARFAVIVMVLVLLPGSWASQRRGQSSNEQTRESMLAAADQAVSNANSLSDQGKFREALPLFEKALETRRRLQGESAADTLFVQESIADLHVSLADYTQAESIYQQVLKARLAAQGPKHPDYAASLARLAKLRYSLADYAGAEPLFRQALAIARESLGDEHPDYFIYLNNLASTCHAKGDYVAAEPLLIQAAKVAFKVHGPQDPNYALALGNLGGFYQTTGDYAQAETLLRRAMEIAKRSRGENDVEYASSLNNLGGLYYDMGDYPRAEPLLEESLRIRRQSSRGANCPEGADVLNNLAALYQSQDKLAEAEKLYQEALEVRKGTVGERHPAYADGLNNLASLYTAAGKTDQAVTLYETALRIHRQVLGAGHLKCATDLNNLAVLNRTTGNLDQARSYYRQALEIIDSVLQATFGVLSERQQLAMVRSLRQTFDGYLSSSARREYDEEWPYQYVLAWKGAVFTQQRRARLISAQPELRPLLTELQNASGRLANLVIAVPPAGDQAAWREQVAQVSQKKESLESALSQKIATSFRLEQGPRIDRLKAVIPADACLIDFLEYAYTAPGAPTGKTLREQRLTAFVVCRGRPVVRRDLGPIAPIEQAVQRWRKSLRRTGEAAEAAAELRRRLWDPLIADIGGARLVLVSPDGVLTRFPFTVLPGKGPGSYLIEDVSLAVVPVPQDLPQLFHGKTLRNEMPRGTETTLMLVGDVDYDVGDDLGNDDVVAPATTPPLRVRFPPLQNTRGETLAVRDSFERTYPQGTIHFLRKRQATKEAFCREATHCQYMLLATHGFLIEPKTEPDQIGQPTAGQQLARYYPALLSGLALTGANRAFDRGDTQGILTAEEVAALNLNETDLAVLSACETGIGETVHGEGAFGLQRAFQVAGARTVVASLWPVGDEATRTLIERFYDNLWGKKMGKLEALREAQLWMLRGGEQRGIQLVPDKANPPPAPRVSPYHWASFVLSGDWR